MYDFITLNVNCPYCNTSLIDHEELVDKKPSIKLGIRADNQATFIFLSSIWGSYNYRCSIPLSPDLIAQFSCPHCQTEITSENACSICSAPLVPFILDMGGRVSICSRSGCRNHFVEFDDVSQAMSKLYQDYGLAGTYTDEERKITARKQASAVTETDHKKEMIESGAFLLSYCPHCHKSLIEHDILKLNITTDGKSGILILSPYMNVFTSESTVYLQEDKPVTDISCPHCNKSMISESKKCEECGSPIAKIFISARTKMISFYLCSKKGCKWHGLSDEDLQDIKLEDSLEW